MREGSLNLVVAAHPDDEILGFGGTGAKFVARGERVQPVFLCGEAEQRRQRPSDDDFASDIARATAVVGFERPVLGDFPNIRLNTVPHVELVGFIERQIEAFAPARIFTHHPADLNDDHNQVARACLAAARLAQRRAGVPPLVSVHFMEILSSTDWAFPHGGGGFAPNEFVEIGDYLDRKLEALACYRHVMRDFPHSRSETTVRALAAVRGSQCGLGYAEAFQTVFSTAMDR